MRPLRTSTDKCQKLATLIRNNWRINLVFFLIGLISSNFIYMISLKIDDKPLKPPISDNTNSFHNQQQIAVIVPFRDRFDELLLFVPHISKFLAQQSIKNFQILVINQIDDYRFNRASLINVGALEAMSNNFTYLIIHDVDLLPLNPKLKYFCPERGVYHISAPGLHPKYEYKTFIGGVMAVASKDFKSVNGMSNRYWGWGREDDEFYLRLRKADMPVNRPKLEELKTGKKFTYAEKHNGQRRPRDKKRFLKQNDEALRFEPSGLNNVQYAVRKRRSVAIEGHSCLVVDVELFCDRSDTHWCSFDYQFED